MQRKTCTCQKQTNQKKTTRAISAEMNKIVTNSENHLTTASANPEALKLEEAATENVQ